MSSFNQVLMRHLLALVVIVSASSVLVPSWAQEPNASQAAKAMLVLDASGSMWGQVDGEHKITIARKVVGDLMTSWAPNIHLGLSAYGHRRKGDCSDIETLAPVGPNTASRVASIVKQINPKGKTPLSDAVRQAAEHLRYTEEAATVILVTDGLETCAADPCAVAAALEENGVDFTAHVIGFDITEEESRSVRCVAELTGGKYHSARTADELRKAMESTIEASKPVLSDKVRMALVEGGPLLEDGYAEFRFLAVDGNGAKTDQQMAQNFGHMGLAEVPAADYVVSIKYSLVDVEAPVTITDEGAEHVVVLNAGILRLNPIVGRNALGLSHTLRWSVFSGANDQSGALSSQLDHGQGGLFVLPSGDYFVKGEISGVKRGRPVQIAAGDTIDLDIDMRSGTLNLRAFLSEGGDQAEGYFQWRAYSLGEDGHSRGELLTSSTPAATAQFELPVGKNLISFADKLVKREITVDIVAEETTTLDLPLNAAILHYQVVNSSGNPIDGWPTVEVYPQGADRATAVRFGYFDQRSGSGHVPAEPLDIVVKVGANSRIYSIAPEPGETLKVVLTVE